MLSVVTRLFRRRRWTAACVLTVVVVVGALTAQFAAVYGIVLKRYPFPHPNRLVMLWERNSNTGVSGLPVTESAFPYYRDHLSRVASLGYFIPPSSSVPVQSADRTAVSCARLSPEMFEVLGVAPSIGRRFTASEGQYPSADVVLLSHDYWTRSHGARPGVVGSTIEFTVAGERRQYIVAGVMPEGFTFPFPLFSPRPDVWVNARQVPGRFLAGHHFYTMGRLNASTSTETFQTSARDVAASIATQQPRAYGSIGVDVRSLRDMAVSDARGVLSALVVGFVVVALLGISNLWHLFFARALEVRDEIRIRTALGARLRHVIALTVSEFGAVLLCGGVLGLGCAYLLLRALPAMIPAGLNLPRASMLLTDPVILVGVVIGWAGLALCLVSVVSYVAWRSARTMAHPLRTRGLDAPGRGARRHAGLQVAAQVALAFGLTAAASAIAGHVTRHQASADVLDPSTILAADLFVPGDDSDATIPRLRELLAQLTASGNVAGAALVRDYPSTDWLFNVQAEGVDGPIGHDWQPAEFTLASHGYANVAGLSVVAGRWFSDDDHASAPSTAVINDVMAQRYFPGINPIGRRLRLDMRDFGPGFDIVGVVHDGRRLTPGRVTRPAIYASWTQHPTSLMSLVVRTPNDARQSAALVRAATLAALPPLGSITRMRSGREIVFESTARATFVSRQLVGLAALAGLLAVTGLYGITAHSTFRRQKELAIRTAVGATPAATVLLVVSDALRAVVWGMLTGLPLAYAVDKVVARASGLPGGASLLPYAVTAALFVIVSSLVSFHVARVAIDDDPLRRLREI